MVTFPTADSGPAIDPADPEPGEFTCLRCGRNLTYGGRGRKPKNCSPSNGGDSACYGTKGAKSSSGVKGGNERLAAQAADVLSGINDIVATGTMFVGFQATASMIAEGNEAFREQAYQALLIDPALAKTILRGGSSSGKIALVMAYAMFLAPVSRVAIQEYRMNASLRRSEGSEE